MDELIRINFDSDCPTVSGRELHDALEINTKYVDWFSRMCEYGFVETQDYFPWTSG
jgi:anti-repressor protein